MENIEKSEFSQNQALSNFMSIDIFLCHKHLFLNLSKSPTEIPKSAAGEKNQQVTENTIDKKKIL